MQVKSKDQKFLPRHEIDKYEIGNASLSNLLCLLSEYNDSKMF